MTDPNGVRSAQLDPQLLAAQRLTREMQMELGAAGDIQAVRKQAAQVRTWWNQGGPAMASVIQAVVPGPLREIPIVIYVPRPAQGLRPAYVYLHGGGYKIGDQHANDRQMRELAHDWGGIVISADYVHVPEHQFPSAIEETAALLEWLSRNGERWGIDGQRLAFGGSSAGANISLGAALHLGGTACSYLRAGALVVGSYGSGTGTESMRLFGGGGFYPSQAIVESGLKEYVPSPQMRADPRFDVLSADPALIPPLFLVAAEYDVFRDASRAMARRLQSHGRPVVLKEYPGMTHVFLGFSRIVDRARECVGDIAAYLTGQLPGTPA